MLKTIGKMAKAFGARAWDLTPDSPPDSKLVRVLTWDELSAHLVTVGAIPPGRHVFSDIDDGLEVYVLIEEDAVPASPR